MHVKRAGVQQIQTPVQPVTATRGRSHVQAQICERPYVLPYRRTTDAQGICESLSGVLDAVSQQANKVLAAATHRLRPQVRQCRTETPAGGRPGRTLAAWGPGALGRRCTRLPALAAVTLTW